jgi:hypothetical protein
MSPLVWLGLALAAGAGGILVAGPAWRSYRSRDERDLNSERYLAWRGRAPRGQHASTREGMTGEERRRLLIGAALGLLGVAALVAFFVTS